MSSGSPLHIVHVVESFGGGVIGFVEQLCRHLPSHRHTVLHAVRASEVDPKVTQARFPAEVEFVLWPHAVREIAPVADLRALLALTRTLPKLKADVVHLHSSKAGFLGRIACRMLGIRSVVYTPGGAAILRQDITEAKRNLYGRLEAIGHRFGGQVVACGRGEAQALAQYGVPAQVIANGTEPGPNPPLRAVPADRPLTVLTLGRATVQKDPARFGRIAQALAGEEQYRFVWVGSGELEHLLPRPAVEVTGWLPASEVRGRLEKADIYLSTAIWEGLSLAVLEGMAAGLPLLLSDCPGNTDVVELGKNGALFHTDEEAIETLRRWAEQPEQLVALGAESRRLLVEEHDVQRVALRYEELYRELAQKA